MDKFPDASFTTNASVITTLLPFKLLTGTKISPGKGPPLPGGGNLLKTYPVSATHQSVGFNNVHPCIAAYPLT